MLIINNVDWGGYSQVDAVLKCCKKLLRSMVMMDIAFAEWHRLSC